MRKHIRIGYGEYVITRGLVDDVPGVSIEEAPVPGPVGADASNSGLDQKKAAPDAVVITFDSKESAQVLIDAINDCFK